MYVQPTTVWRSLPLELTVALHKSIDDEVEKGNSKKFVENYLMGSAWGGPDGEEG
jgi:hypothetical protein